MSLGAIVVPAYTSNTEEDNNYLLTHSQAKLAITSGGNVASRLCLAADNNKFIKNIIIIDADPKIFLLKVVNYFHGMRKLGRLILTVN